MKVPTVFMTGVALFVAEVAPRSPLKGPVPEQEVASVELNEMVEVCPVVMVAELKAWRVTVGAGAEFTVKFVVDQPELTQSEL